MNIHDAVELIGYELVLFYDSNVLRYAGPAGGNDILKSRGNTDNKG